MPSELALIVVPPAVIGAWAEQQCKACTHHDQLVEALTQLVNEVAALSIVSADLRECYGNINTRVLFDRNKAAQVLLEKVKAA